MKGKSNITVKAALTRQLKKDVTVRNQTRIVVEKQFRVAFDKFMGDFESHPLTRELKHGPGASNVTGTLRNGNVFGFIGFDADYNPIAPIEKLLRGTNILIKRQSMGTRGLLTTFSVNTPQMTALYSASPMPWAKGASWLEQIEGAGISGLGQYLFKRVDSSRSGAGIQLKDAKGSGRLKIPYLKPMLKEFEKNLNNITGAMKIK